jgi:hypothetical protein
MSNPIIDLQAGIAMPASVMTSLKRILCVDCAADGIPFNVITAGHYCMLKDSVWLATGMLDDGDYFSGVLCLQCIEDRLGRRLKLRDFAISRSNADRTMWSRGKPMTPRVWQEWEALGRKPAAFTP